MGDVQVSPDGSRVAYSWSTTTRPGRPYAVVTILDLQTGRSHTLPRGILRPALGARRPAAGLRRPGRRGRRPDGLGSRWQRRALPGADRRHQPSAPLGRRVGGVGARRPAHRLRLGHAGPRRRRRQRRPDGDHALPVQADRRRRVDAVQRQSPHAPVRRRRRHPAGHPAHRGHRLRAFDRLGAGRRRDRVRVQPRGQPRSHLQLRRVQRVGAHQAGAPDHVHQERRVRAGVVARRHPAGLCRHAAGSDLVGDDDGGHPRLGDECRRQPAGRDRAPAWTTARASRAGRPTDGTSISRCRSAARSGWRGCRRPAARSTWWSRTAAVSAAGAWARAASPTRSLPPEGPRISTRSTSAPPRRPSAARR